MFDGARLTQARQLHGYTKKALAEEVEVSAAAVGQYESGTTRPRPEVVRRMAEVLGVPVEFFAFAPLRPRLLLDVSMAHFKSLRSMRAGERERAGRFVEKVGEVASALEVRVRLPRVGLPGWPGDERTVLDVPSPAAAARSLRRTWGLGGDPIPHMVRLLESQGIIVTLLPFSDSGRVGAFSFSNLGRPIVVLTSDRDDVYRHRFHAAHELGHLVLHGEARPGDIEYEREADAFAAEFLVPSASVMAQLPARPNFSVYAKLQVVWGVSIESLIYRSRELGLLGDVSYRRAWQTLAELKTAGFVKPESIRRFPGECPVMLKKALHMTSERGFGLVSLASELALFPEMVAAFVGQDEVELPEVVVDLAEKRLQKAARTAGANKGQTALIDESEGHGT